WIVPVVSHCLGTATNDLTVLTRRQRPVLVVEDSDLGDREGTTARAYTIMILGLKAGDNHRTLGLPVRLREDATKALFGALKQRRRDRRGAVSNGTQGEHGGIDPRNFEHHRQHCWYQKRVIAAFA